MSKDVLRQRLTELQDELERTDTSDPESQQRLREVLEEFEQLLEGDDDASDDSLVGRLREATREFEASHPRVAETVERVVDALAAMGI